ncbi:MAG: 50S ribosomal protein L23 [Verrucomicrobiales bacterium]|jgi:large subunit ribosomal protein L23|nr:50S ribosomal protein L23 [Verrucomicrobiales bacterium]
MKNPYDIIKTARITEKAGALTERHNQYVFKVERTATKLDIKYAIEEIFKKKVAAVNTLRVTGKKKRERTASFGRKPSWKKAIVTLKAGEKLELI